MSSLLKKCCSCGGECGDPSTGLCSVSTWTCPSGSPPDTYGPTIKFAWSNFVEKDYEASGLPDSNGQVEEFATVVGHVNLYHESTHDTFSMRTEINCFGGPGSGDKQLSQLVSGPYPRNNTSSEPCSNMSSGAVFHKPPSTNAFDCQPEYRTRVRNITSVFDAACEATYTYFRFRSDGSIDKKQTLTVVCDQPVVLESLASPCRYDPDHYPYLDPTLYVRKDKCVDNSDRRFRWMRGNTYPDNQPKPCGLGSGFGPTPPQYCSTKFTINNTLIKVSVRKTATLRTEVTGGPNPWNPPASDTTVSKVETREFYVDISSEYIREGNQSNCNSVSDLDDARKITRWNHGWPTGYSYNQTRTPTEILAWMSEGISGYNPNVMIAYGSDYRTALLDGVNGGWEHMSDNFASGHARSPFPHVCPDLSQPSGSEFPGGIYPTYPIKWEARGQYNVQPGPFGSGPPSGDHDAYFYFEANAEVKL